MRITENKG